MTTPAALTTTVRGTADDALLLHLGRQGQRVPGPIFVVALVIGAMAMAKAPASAVASWLAAEATVLGLRFFAMRRFARGGSATAQGLRMATALSVAHGLVFAASFAFTPYLTTYERIVHTLLILGLCTGSVATTAGYPRCHLTFTIPTIGTLGLTWLIYPGSDLEAWVGRSIGLLAFSFGALLIAMARDTRRLFLESFDLQSRQDELNQRLRAALDAAEAANRAKTRFLASASHDLRQPMHTLSLFAEALWLRPLDESTRHIAANLRTASSALGSQLDALLDISKLDADVVAVNVADVDLGALVQRLHEQYLSEAERRNLFWKTANSGPMFCRTDPLHLERILRNLIENAFKYTSRGGISIDFETRDGEHHVRITDSGVGIEASEMERVFEEFYQVDNPSRDRTQGLGLGLSIVKRLADLIGVRVALTSQPGAGTKALLSIEASAPPALQARGSRSEVAEVSGLHVLVVDDEEQVRAGMGTLLDGLGCSTDLVATTVAAREAAVVRTPHIVIADLRLRGDDSGLAAIAGVRAVVPGLPALLVSGDTAPERLREAHEAGIRMLHKPVTLDDLMAAIERELAA